MPDPVREALEAAAKALSAASLDWGDDEPEIWGGHREQASEAIAAFLRRMADTSPSEFSAEEFEELASAVEAAAREGG